PRAGYNVIVSSELLLLHDGIVVAFDDGIIRKYTTDGKLLWSYTTTFQPQRVFAADAQGNIAIGLHSNDIAATDSLIMLNANGTERWAHALHNTRITSNAIVLRNGTIVIGGERRSDGGVFPVLHCYSQTGQSLWSRNTVDTPRGLSVSDDTSFVVSGIASVLFAEPKSSVRLHSVTSGDVVWELFYQAAIVSSAIVSENYITFVATQNKATGVYRMNKGGANVELLSVSDTPLFIPEPALAPNGTLIFSLRDYCGTLRVGKREAFGLVPL
ncbi:MAG: PQQ-binding-like beta-propeller repeat protein, partial [Candidatus Kapabacteria bacterium]|nr:PQQ-binding-like beta-propeller repeat protein [Candidatus Kapabacteria bacterium]